MKRQASLFPALIMSLLTSAQNWCPPGATWTYYMQASWGEGFYEHLYAGDTLLGGLVGQNIHSTSTIFYLDIGAAVVDPPHYYITTRRDTDIVWWWEPDLMAWDTLYDFAASPGDKWLPPNFVGICPPHEWIEVVDTGHVLISSVALRYLDVMQVAPGDTVFSRITERLGWEWEMNIWPPCVEPPQNVFGLHCYNDVEISWSSPDWAYGCHSLVGVEERTQLPISIFPNPGTDHFTISLSPGPHTIRLIDPIGREALLEQQNGPHAVVLTADLSPGHYTVQVNGERIGRWVKR